MAVGDLRFCTWKSSLKPLHKSFQVKPHGLLATSVETAQLVKKSQQRAILYLRNYLDYSQSRFSLLDELPSGPRFLTSRYHCSVRKLGGWLLGWSHLLHHFALARPCWAPQHGDSFLELICVDHFDPAALCSCTKCPPFWVTIQNWCVEIRWQYPFSGKGWEDWQLLMTSQRKGTRLDKSVAVVHVLQPIWAHQQDLLPKHVERLDRNAEQRKAESARPSLMSVALLVPARCCVW